MQEGFGSMSLPPLPAGMPQFDVNNPMDAFMQMQAMAMPFPGLHSFPQLNFGGRPPRHQPKRKGRCRDFDTKGFCYRGSTCMYDHGNESIYVPPSASNGDGKKTPLPCSSPISMPCGGKRSGETSCASQLAMTPRNDDFPAFSHRHKRLPN